jgi:RHS repeat-associated protein
MVQGFLWLDELHPAAELGANGGIVGKFIYADKANVPSVMYKNGYEYRIISDHLGSVRMVVDNNSGAILQQLDYDPYGWVIVDTNPGFQPFGYAGGLYDRDTGLVRFGRRDYDPVVGRWTSKDPIGFAGGLNLYGYVVQDPVNLVDPEGEMPGNREEYLKPGDYAQESIPATGRRASIAQRQSMQEIGSRTGCHTCGRFVDKYCADHQPVTQLNFEGLDQRLYPQCQACSSRQGGHVSAIVRLSRITNVMNVLGLGLFAVNLDSMIAEHQAELMAQRCIADERWCPS